MSKENGKLSRRDFLRGTAVVGFVSILAACAPAPTAEPEAPPEEPEEEAEPTAEPPMEESKAPVVWYNNADPVRNAWEENVVEMFKAKQPDIEVQLMIVPWDEFEPKMAALLAAGNPPDVWSEWGSSGFMDYYHRGMLHPITDFVTRDDAEVELDQYPEKLIDLFRVEGELYGIPMFNLHNEVFYNKNLFDEAGIDYPTPDYEDKSWDFDAMLDLALQLTVTDPDPTKAVWGLEYGGYMQHACAPWPWGKDFFGPDFGEEAYRTGIAKQATVDDPDVIAGLQWQADLRHELKVHPTQAAYEALSALGGAFRSGRLAMTLNGGWMWWVNIPITEFEWGVAAMPWGPESHRSVMYTDPWFMAKDTPDPDRTWEFVKYTMSDEGLHGLIDGLGCTPAKNSMLPVFYDKYPNMDRADIETVTVGAVPDGQESPNHRLVGYDQIHKTLTADLDLLWLGESTAAEIAPGLEERMNQAIEAAAATI